METALGLNNKDKTRFIQCYRFSGETPKIRKKNVYKKISKVQNNKRWNDVKMNYKDVRVAAVLPQNSLITMWKLGLWTWELNRRHFEVKYDRRRRTRCYCVIPRKRKYFCYYEMSIYWAKQNLLSLSCCWWEFLTIAKMNLKQNCLISMLTVLLNVVKQTNMLVTWTLRQICLNDKRLNPVFIEQATHVMHGFYASRFECHNSNEDKCFILLLLL